MSCSNVMLYYNVIFWLYSSFTSSGITTTSNREKSAYLPGIIIGLGPGPGPIRGMGCGMGPGPPIGPAGIGGPGTGPGPGAGTAGPEEPVIINFTCNH